MPLASNFIVFVFLFIFLEAILGWSICMVLEKLLVHMHNDTYVEFNAITRIGGCIQTLIV
jgi:hypothetical protein